MHESNDGSTDPQRRAAITPEPPYYAVIFTSIKQNDDGYRAMSERMNQLAREQPGFLGVESARDQDEFGITVSYWISLQSIADWKRHAEHRIAQESGRLLWYREYVTRIARVERDYSFSASSS